MWDGKWMPFDPNYRFSNQERAIPYETRATPLDPSREYRLRIPIIAVEDAVRFFFAPVERIRRSMKKNAHEVEVILRGKPTNDYRHTGCPNFPEMEEGFGIDGSTYRVHIY